MADQAQPQATEEQWWEDAARRLPPVAAVLVGAVWGAASQAVWAVLFLLAAWLLVVVLGSALPLRGQALGSCVLAAAMLGSLGMNARLHGRLRRVSRMLSFGFGVCAVLTALALLYMGLALNAFAQIAPD